MKKQHSKVSSAIKVEFDSGHRVIGHEHKCKYLHGHRYVLEVSVCSEFLNELGMVVDFGVLKSRIKGWIDDNFDHTVILCDKDKDLGDFIEKYTGQKIYYLPFNPTSENIALYLRNFILEDILVDEKQSFVIDKIKLQETPNCYSIV